VGSSVQVEHTEHGIFELKAGIGCCLLKDGRNSRLVMLASIIWSDYSTSPAPKVSRTLSYIKGWGNECPDGPSLTKDLFCIHNLFRAFLCDELVTETFPNLRSNEVHHEEGLKKAVWIQRGRDGMMCLRWYGGQSREQLPVEKVHGERSQFWSYRPYSAPVHQR